GAGAEDEPELGGEADGLRDVLRGRPRDRERVEVEQLAPAAPADDHVDPAVAADALEPASTGGTAADAGGHRVRTGADGLTGGRHRDAEALGDRAGARTDEQALAGRQRAAHRTE